MEHILSVETLSVLFCAAFLVGMINAMFGVGGSLLAYPLLLHWLPGKTIVGVLSIIVIAATTHRLVLYREHLSLRAVQYFLVLGVPFSIGGAYTLSWISVENLQGIVGIFLISMTLFQWSTDKDELQKEKRKGLFETPKYFVGVGAVSGFLTGLIGSAGFFNTTFLLRAGLVKEGISVTQAGIALAYSLIKFPVYWKYEIVNESILLAGAVGSIGSVFGTFLGSRLLKNLSVEGFTILLRLLILFAGSNLIFDWL